MNEMTPGYGAALNAVRGTEAPRVHKDMSPAKVRESAEEFEAFFLSQTLSNMFKGIKPDRMFGGRHVEAVYRELQFQEYGKVIAKSGGVGIADSIVRQLLSTQEVSQQ